WKAPFAVKGFQQEVFEKNPQIAERFVQEARTWIKLERHENICQAFFVKRIENEPFLFLELITGGDLQSWIGTPKLTVLEVLRLALQFCDGMVHAVDKGLVAHRDIKPQNCLITADGTLKITDFGLAKVFEKGNAVGLFAEPKS